MRFGIRSWPHELKRGSKVFRESGVKVLRWFAVLPGVTLGVLAGLLLTVPLERLASAPRDPKPNAALPEVARLSPAELETLALDALTTLHEKREAAAGESSWGRAGPDPRQIHLGIDNVRRLLPLGKRLTLRSLKSGLKSSVLAREGQLIAAVRRVVLDMGLGNAAAVSEDDLSVIRIGPGYAAYLTSDEEAMLVLGHELTHVAARGGRMGDYMEGVSVVARQSADVELNVVQKEELACDFTAAQVLKRFIALRPTARSRAGRFSSAFGYAPRSIRLSRAWQDFCTSYNGDPADAEHLSREQLFRVLPRLDPELKALIPDDAVEPRLCRRARRR